MKPFIKCKHYISWDTTFQPRDWKVGDEMNLPTPFGYCVFKITKIESDHIEWMSGDLLTWFDKCGRVWKWNHCMVDAKAVAKIQFT